MFVYRVKCTVQETNETLPCAPVHLRFVVPFRSWLLTLHAPLTSHSTNLTAQSSLAMSDRHLYALLSQLSHAPLLPSQVGMAVVMRGSLDTYQLSQDHCQ